MNRHCGTAAGVSAAVPGVHAMPGFTALTAIPVLPRRRFSASVARRLRSFGVPVRFEPDVAFP